MNASSILIPDIYNFCDSWCERCPLTARCRSFQMQETTGPGQPLPTGELLVKQLVEALNMTRQHLSRVGQRQQPDTVSATRQQQLEAGALPQQPDLRDHPLAVLTGRYLRQTGTWLRQEGTLLEAVGNAQMHAITLGIRSETEAMVILTEQKNAWDMIRWYRTLIPVKTLTALRSVTEPNSNGPLTNYYLGKAKLVLVSIDQSFLGWQTLLAHYPEKTDDILDLLVLLQHIQQRVETLFPAARTFKRPGLD